MILNDDGKLLSSYSGLHDNAVLLLLILTPFVVYVQGVDGRKHTLTIESAQPDVRKCDAAVIRCMYVRFKHVCAYMHKMQKCEFYCCRFHSCAHLAKPGCLSTKQALHISQCQQTPNA